MPELHSPAGQGVSGLLGPVPSRCAGAGLAARGAGPFTAIVCDHARRPRAGGDRRARAGHAADRDGVRRELPGLHQAGRAARAQGRGGEHRGIGGGRGKGVLIVDDLVDTGKTAKVVRDAPAGRAFRDRLCQADGPAAGRHLHHRGVAGHLDLFSLGYRACIPAADPRRWPLMNG